MPILGQETDLNKRAEKLRYLKEQRDRLAASSGIKLRAPMEDSGDILQPLIDEKIVDNTPPALPELKPEPLTMADAIDTGRELIQGANPDSMMEVGKELFGKVREGVGSVMSYPAKVVDQATKLATGGAGANLMFGEARHDLGLPPIEDFEGTSAAEGLGSLVKEATGGPAIDEAAKAIRMVATDNPHEKLGGFDLPNVANASEVFAAAHDEASKQAGQFGADPMMLLMPSSKALQLYFVPDMIGNATKEYEEAAKLYVASGEVVTPDVARLIVRGTASTAFAGTAGAHLVSPGHAPAHELPPLTEEPPVTGRRPIEEVNRFQELPHYEDSMEADLPDNVGPYVDPPGYDYDPNPQMVDFSHPVSDIAAPPKIHDPNHKSAFTPPEREAPKVEAPLELPDDSMAAAPGDPRRDANFKNWFGKSAIVDKDGAPLQVYHGTDERFNTFSEGHSPIGFHFGNTSQATDRVGPYAAGKSEDFFADPEKSEIASEAYNNAGILPVHLRMEHPFEIPFDSGSSPGGLLEAMGRGGLFDHDQYNGMRRRLDGEIAAAMEAARAEGKDPEAARGVAANAFFKKLLESNGYDGVKYHNDVEGNVNDPSNDAYIVFDPTQVKSSKGNVGTYSREHPDIRAQELPPMREEEIDLSPLKEEASESDLKTKREDLARFTSLDSPATEVSKSTGHNLESPPASFMDIASQVPRPDKAVRDALQKSPVIQESLEVAKGAFNELRIIAAKALENSSLDPSRALNTQFGGGAVKAGVLGMTHYRNGSHRILPNLTEIAEDLVHDLMFGDVSHRVRASDDRTLSWGDDTTRNRDAVADLFREYTDKPEKLGAEFKYRMWANMVHEWAHAVDAASAHRNHPVLPELQDFGSTKLERPNTEGGLNPEQRFEALRLMIRDMKENHKAFDNFMKSSDNAKIGSFVLELADGNRKLYGRSPVSPAATKLVPGLRSERLGDSPAPSSGSGGDPARGGEGSPGGTGSGAHAPKVRQPMSVERAKKVLENYGLTPEQIDKIITSKTGTPPPKATPPGTPPPTPPAGTGGTGGGGSGKGKRKKAPPANFPELTKEQWLGKREAIKYSKEVLKRELVKLGADKWGVLDFVDFEANPNDPKFARVKSLLDQWYVLESATGLPTKHRKGYLPHYWEDPKHVIKTNAKKLGARPGFVDPRKFKTYAEGIAAGHKPQYSNMADLLLRRYGASLKGQADRQLWNHLKQNKLIAPITSKRARAGGYETLDPRHLPLHRVRKRKKDQLIQAYGTKPEIAKYLHNYLKPDEQSILKKLAGLNSSIKNIILSGGIPFTAINFHGMMNIRGRHAGAVGILKGNVQALNKMFDFHAKKSQEFLDKNYHVLPEAVEDGLVVTTEEHGIPFHKQLEGWKEEWKTYKQKGLVGKVIKGPGQLGSLMRIGHGIVFEDPLFQKVIPALKLQFYMENKTKMGGKKAAELANQVYGGINYMMEGRAKDKQNLLRATLLAPDWAETHYRIAKGTLKSLRDPKTPEAGLYRALVKRALIAYAIKNGIQLALTGQTTESNQRGHETSIDLGKAGKKKRYLVHGGSDDFLKIPYDIVSAIVTHNLDRIPEIIGGRVSPLVSAAVKVATNKDHWGKKLLSKDLPPLRETANLAAEIGEVTLPQYVQGPLDLALGRNETWEETLAESFEMPLRYPTERGDSKSGPGWDWSKSGTTKKRKKRYKY